MTSAPDRITLTLPFPPSANRYYRSVGPRVLISAEGRAYRTRVAQVVATARLAGFCGPRAITGRVAVSMKVFPPDRRRRDLDNLRKALWDSLTTAGVWVDDCQVDEDHAYRCQPTPGGRVVVTIEEIGQQRREAA